VTAAAGEIDGSGTGRDLTMAVARRSCCGLRCQSPLTPKAATARTLNVLWQPGTTLAQLGEAGVARVSTGSALYRRALAAGVAAAVAAQQDRPPLGSDLRHDGAAAISRARFLIRRPRREYVSRAIVDRCHESCRSNGVWRP
jgi:hypothetical protein